MNAINETLRLPGYYWIKLDCLDAEEACWDGHDWFVSGSRTRIAGDVLVLTPRTAALPPGSLEDFLVDADYY